MSVQVRGRIQNPQPGERAFERMTSELSERIIALEKEVRRLGGGEVDTFTSPDASPYGGGAQTSTTVVNNITQGETNHGLLVGLEDDDHPQYVQHGWQTPPLPHIHATGPAAELTEQPSSGGTSTLLARSDHRHLKLIQAEDEGADLGSVSAVNLQGPGLDVEVEPNLTGSLLTGLYGHWPSLRRCTIGSGGDFTEVGGTVPSASGRFTAPAVSSTESDAFGLELVFDSPFAISAGYSWSYWFRWPSWASGSFKAMLGFHSGTFGAYADPSSGCSRFFNSNFIDYGISWSGGTLPLPVPRLGPFDVDEWHMFVSTYDSATGTIVGYVDEGCLPVDDFQGVTPPFVRLKAIVPPASLATVNASTFTRFQALKRWNGSSVNFDGRLAALSIWNRTLTRAEVARLWVNFRATVSANFLAMRVFGG